MTKVMTCYCCFLANKMKLMSIYRLGMLQSAQPSPMICWPSMACMYNPLTIPQWSAARKGCALHQLLSTVRRWWTSLLTLWSKSGRTTIWVSSPQSAPLNATVRSAASLIRSCTATSMLLRSAPRVFTRVALQINVSSWLVYFSLQRILLNGINHNFQLVISGEIEIIIMYPCRCVCVFFV